MVCLPHHRGKNLCGKFEKGAQSMAGVKKAAKNAVKSKTSGGKTSGGKKGGGSGAGKAKKAAKKLLK
jgi:hypothetical protein